MLEDVSGRFPRKQRGRVSNMLTLDGRAILGKQESRKAEMFAGQ